MKTSIITMLCLLSCFLYVGCDSTEYEESPFWLETPYPPGNNVTDLRFIEDWLFAATDAGLFTSTNYGLTWDRALGIPTTVGITALCQEGDSVYAATSTGDIYRSINEGVQWSKLLAAKTITKIEHLAVIDSTLFAESNDVLYRRTPSDTIWTVVNFPGLDRRIHALASCKQTLFIGNGVNDRYDTYGGAYCTSDLGVSWKFVFSGVVASFFSTDDSLLLGHADGLTGLSKAGNDWKLHSYPVEAGQLKTIYAVSRFKSYYLALTNYGVSYSTDTGVSWRNEKMPNANYPPVKVAAGNKILIAVSHDKHVWRLPL